MQFLWAQCLLARAWISMDTVTRRMQRTQRFLFVVLQERPASHQTTGSAQSTAQFGPPKSSLAKLKVLGMMGLIRN